MNYAHDSSVRSVGNILNRGFNYYIAIPILTGLILSLYSLGGSIRDAKAAQVASDPVIAAAGDIACDPGESGFNGGNGTLTRCRQKYTSDLLVNANLSAVLVLGDNQYYCGS